MTWTWEQVISLALVRSGLVGRSQPIKAVDNAIGESTLGLLLDELDGQGYALPNFATDVNFVTVANVAKYWLGQGVEVEANSIRPEQIITATVTISTGPDVNMVIAPISFQEFKKIAVPDVTGYPYNYAINETWPQMEIHFYPVPLTAYPIRLTSKVKWQDTVGLPEDDLMAEAKLASGYANALVDMLALRLAEPYRLETETLRQKDTNARFVIANYVAQQINKKRSELPIGVFPWNIGYSRKNLW